MKSVFCCVRILHIEIKIWGTLVRLAGLSVGETMGKLMGSSQSLENTGIVWEDNGKWLYWGQIRVVAVGPGEPYTLINS